MKNHSVDSLQEFMLISYSAVLSARISMGFLVVNVTSCSLVFIYWDFCSTNVPWKELRDVHVAWKWIYHM